MLNLSEYQKRPTRLADYLPWVSLIAPGVIPPSGMPDSRWGFPSGPISDSMW